MMSGRTKSSEQILDIHHHTVGRTTTLFEVTQLTLPCAVACTCRPSQTQTIYTCMAPKSLWDPLSSGNLPKIRDIIPSPWSTTLHAKQLLKHEFYSIGYGGRYGHTALSNHWASCVCISLALARLPAYGIGQRIEPRATHALAAWPAHCTLPRT